VLHAVIGQHLEAAMLAGAAAVPRFSGDELRLTSAKSSGT
jgi:hypothetical protein